MDRGGRYGLQLVVRADLLFASTDRILPYAALSMDENGAA
jgi:hypothetical protein